MVEGNMSDIQEPFEGVWPITATEGRKRE